MDSEQPRPADEIYGPHNWRLIRVKGNTPWHLWIAGPGASFWMHWDPNARRTQPCVKGSCVQCDMATPRRPLTYVPVYYWGLHNGGITWRRAVLEVPFRTGVQLYDLQGRGVCLRRTSANGRVECSTMSFRTEPEQATTFSILPQLQALWRIPRSQQLSLVTADTV